LELASVVNGASDPDGGPCQDSPYGPKAKGQ
jgi:hypothetical protein